MENRRALMILSLALLAVNASAYGNLGPHQKINEIAFQKYTTSVMPQDPGMKGASLDGALSKGIAWDVSDGTDSSSLEYAQTMAIDRTKSLEDWITGGGFSADEPEIPMALRHFYDPLRDPSYLTDYPKVYGFPHPKDPQTSALDWAFKPTENEYSFESGKKYMQLALADSEPGNLNYGRAWRSVGETMHLISDMTVPAHVRNDGHIPKIDPDVYETSIKSSTIEAYMDGPSANLNYKCTDPKGKDLKTLMQDVAKWTNENFFSKDTVTRPGSDQTVNKKEAYPSPQITGEPSANGYYYWKIDNYHNYDDSDASLADKMKLATTQVTGIFFKKTLYKIDASVIIRQKEMLIPTAIRASESVLDAFLPRFTVKIDSVSTDPKDPGKKIVEAHIEHVPTREWPGELKIGNGAHIVAGKTDNTLKLQDNKDNPDNMNKIKYSVQANEGDKISVYYDLGGYKTAPAEYSQKTMDSLILVPEDAPDGLKLYSDDFEIEENQGRQEAALYNAQMNRGMNRYNNIEYKAPGYDCTYTNNIHVTLFLYPRYSSGNDLLEGYKKNHGKGTVTGSAGISGAGLDLLIESDSDGGTFKTYRSLFEKNGWIADVQVNSLSEKDRAEAYKSYKARCIDGLKKEDAKVYEDKTMASEEIVKHLAQRITEKTV